jgi:hypothetical protein
MKFDRASIRWTQVLEIAISLVAAAIGLKLAYDIGMRMAGVWLGVIMGFNGGLFCLLTASLVTERLFRRKPPRTGG